MGPVHPLEVQPYHLNSAPTKRRRLSSHAWTSPVNNLLPAGSLGAPAWRKASSASLDSVPVEILAVILDISCEASLIHTSKRLWSYLPSFVHYTRSLALTALVQLEDFPENPVTPTESFIDVAHVHRTLDADVQQHVRQKVFSSGWFQEHHLNRTHRTLLYSTILNCCSWYGDNAPSKYQRQRIKCFVERQSAPSSSAVLYLRVPSGGRRIRYLSAKQLSVTISGAPFFRPLSLKVLDFGNTVPDLLLRMPFTSSKAMVVREMCKTIWIPREDNSLICNRKLLHEALSHAIAFCDVEKFYVLLSLEARSRGKATDKATVIDLRQIRQAVVHGRPSMLIRLLKQLWMCPKMAGVSTEDLVSTMDQARAIQYPDSQNTTRVLAMEVAAKWKMAEIERSGRKAHRVPMDWPPRLIYPTSGSGESQIWFIPRDANHDVDWEASRDVPWLPFEYA